MLFKISNDKVDKESELAASHAVGDSQLTVIPNVVPTTKSPSSQLTKSMLPVHPNWTPYWMAMAVVVVVLVSMTLSFIYYSVAYFQTDCPINEGLVAEGRCYHKHRWGQCLNQSHCCDGEYVIARGICGGQGLCCLGNADKCKGKQRVNSKRGTDVWSYRSLTTISSLIICRNVSEPVVEQAIVYTVSALEDKEYYHEMSEKVSRELTKATGQQWYAVVGSGSSYDMYLKPFTAYIIVTIRDLELVLFSTNVSSMYPLGMDPDDLDYYGPGAADYPDVDFNRGDVVREMQHVLDSGPSIEIIRNELNDTLRDFAVQTIDFAFNVCSHSLYTCVTYKTVGALNQQYVAHHRGEPGFDTDATQGWQCIVSSNTALDQLVVGIDYQTGSLLDVIYAHRHRVVIFKWQQVLKHQTTEWDVIKGARKALELNKTVILDQNLVFPINNVRKAKRVDTIGAMAMKDIRRAVMTQTKYWSICQKLTHGGDIPGQIWWDECVAGAEKSFSRAISDKRRDKHYFIVKLNELVIILFQKLPEANIVVNTLHVRAG